MTDNVVRQEKRDRESTRGATVYFKYINIEQKNS